MRATRIAHRLEGFCRNGRERQLGSSGGRLRYRTPRSAPSGVPFRGLGHIIEGSNAELANAQVGERFNDAMFTGTAARVPARPAYLGGEN